MPAPIIFWEPFSIPTELQNELGRRKINRSFNFVNNNKGEWNSSTGDWSHYRGPMTSWIRVCSNGYGKHNKNVADDRRRFILHGGKGFYQTYGFLDGSSVGKSTGTKYQIIGYTPGVKGGQGPQPHIIENDFVNTVDNSKKSNWPIHIPTPEVSRLEVTIQKELYRRATIEWSCFSWKQLEYMTPYFFVPGITVMIEWGWNHFNPVSLVDLSDENSNTPVSMINLWNNQNTLYDNILNSRGNYELIYGIITNYNWSIEGTRILCSAEITSFSRLYAGIAKNSAIVINTTTKDNEYKGVLQSIVDFIKKDDTSQNLQTIADSSDIYTAATDLSKKTSQNNVWIDIINSILNDDDKTLKIPYIYGIFSGRLKKYYSQTGVPKAGDFDLSTINNNNSNRIWVNMGMIVEILNHFSARDGVASKTAFKVDITRSVIGGHPNLISCDPNVLIPNYKAPKYHYGSVGFENFKYGTTDLNTNKNNTPSNLKNSKILSEYVRQYAFPIRIPPKSPASPDLTLAQVLYQLSVPEARACYRSNLDSQINFLRYNNIENSGEYLHSYSFPSSETADIGDGQIVETDVSGLLSNLYISYEFFKSIILSTDEKILSYRDIYEKIFKKLTESVDGFWDLALVDVPTKSGAMTIVDRKYLGKVNKLNGDKVYSFDYYDADSLIKTLKFRPQLTDVQATRAIYGSTNNPATKYTSIDKNDILNFEFKDAIILPPSGSQGDPNGDLERKNKTAKEQFKSILSRLQTIIDNKDEALQMTIPSPYPERDEYIKLILPNTDDGQQILRMLLDDHDEENNNRYCAIQPGITLELTILGLGGLRTFQYFLMKNLPEPYSEKNVIFRITDVIHTLETGNWETTIRAGLLPLRKYIKNRLNPPSGGWAV